MDKLQYLKRIASLYKQLDQLTNKQQIEVLLEREIKFLCDRGFTQQEILSLFRTELFTEQQSIDAMIDNHQDYVDMVSAILGE